MDFKGYINKKVSEILGHDVIIEIPPKDGMGDYSIQCAAYRTEELKSPFDVANRIKDNFIDDKGYFIDIKVMGPYVNFYVDYDKLSSVVIDNIISSGSKYGSLNQGNGSSLLIEHTSINPNAEPHIGRCRNSLLGDFMSRLYDFCGYDVERHYYINDLGKKIALLIIGIEKYGLTDDSFASILDVYVKISKDAKEDESIEKLSFDYLEKVEAGDSEFINKFKSITDKCVEGQLKIFGEMGISWDVFTHESDYVYNDYLNSILDKLKEKGKFFTDELGRGCVDLSGYDIALKEPVMVLTRSNNTSLYPIKDIAYTIYKMNLNSENNFIVLGEDQETYFKEISAIMDILGYKSPKLISYAYVLLDGGRMSTSGGTVVLVTDFIKAVKDTLKKEFSNRSTDVSDEDLRTLCNACVKFTMLNVSKNKIVNFNLDNATSFTGESGMYILYSIVRINSILKNNNIELTSEVKFTTDVEKKIVKSLYNFPSVVDELLKSYEPSHLTKYIFNLTQDFSRFYENVNISNEEDTLLKSSRIKLLICIKTVLENALSILGISTVDKM